jgi:hypothetical protein
MATKNLSRTIIEGARYNRDKWKRKQSIRAERRQAKEYCQEVLDDPETDEIIQEYGGDKRRYRLQKDKLQPLQRYLESNVGRSWDAIYSKLKSRFDERNIKGYHLLNDHIRNNVDGAGGEYGSRPIDPNETWGYKSFYIDNNRILRQYPQRKNQPKERISDVEFDRMPDFLGMRKVMRNGGIICWMEPCNPAKALKAFFGRYRDLEWTYRKREWVDKPEGTVDYWGRKVYGYWKTVTIGEDQFRQGKELTATEMADWKAFSERAQDFMLTSSACTKNNDCPSCGQKYDSARPKCGYCGTEVQ